MKNIIFGSFHRLRCEIELTESRRPKTYGSDGQDTLADDIHNDETNNIVFCFVFF